MKKSTQLETDDKHISVEIVFAGESKQKIVQLELSGQVTARQAVNQASLSNDFPEFDFASAPLGIFGTKVPDNYLLADQDRVEIYRPLQQTPQETRRQRVKIARKRTDQK
ncbi:MAG: RnfH family protein [Gammaproteobacteria bacterium]|nr:RnfH family protein [Gammaproteobacteria bacterium]